MSRNTTEWPFDETVVVHRLEPDDHTTVALADVDEGDLKHRIVLDLIGLDPPGLLDASGSDSNLDLAKGTINLLEVLEFVTPQQVVDLGLTAYTSDVFQHHRCWVPRIPHCHISPISWTRAVRRPLNNSGLFQTSRQPVPQCAIGPLPCWRSIFFASSSLTRCLSVLPPLHFSAMDRPTCRIRC